MISLDRLYNALCITVPPPASVTFVPSREGPFYQGTSLTLTCTVTLDRSLVDTDVAIGFVFSNVPSTRVTTSDMQFTDSGTAQFSVLLPEDDGVSYLCATLFRPLASTPFIRESDNAASANYTLRADGE